MSNSDDFKRVSFDHCIHKDIHAKDTEFIPHWRSALDDIVNNPLISAVCEAVGQAVEELGPGLDEGRYHSAIFAELSTRDLESIKEPAIGFVYKGKLPGNRTILFPDIIIHSSPSEADGKSKNTLVVELKVSTTGNITAASMHQLRHYLHQLRADTGLLVNISHSYTSVSACAISRDGDNGWRVVGMMIHLSESKMRGHRLVWISPSENGCGQAAKKRKHVNVPNI